MRQSQQTKILDILLKAKGKPVSMRTLNGVCFRYGGRLHELRKKGYKIKTIQNKRGDFSYTL